MTVSTYSEILEVLESTYDSVLTFIDEFDDNIEGIGPCNQIEHFGGEGKGDTYYDIFHFPEQDIYIKVEGWYTSYHGVDYSDGWSCCRQVKPAQKTIVVYESL